MEIPDKPPNDIRVPCVVVSKGDRIGYIHSLDKKTFKKFQKRHRGYKITVTWCLNDDDEVSIETPVIDTLKFEYETTLSILLDMEPHEKNADTESSYSSENEASQTALMCPFFSNCSYEFPQFFMDEEENEDFITTFCLDDDKCKQCSEYCHLIRKYPPEPAH